eukprot:TRINITY_DN915_c0_g1_i4.p1 TRINITY_DN915_c0_g1~~TRINITY_DN915_c0_g1_i4.p1  ORF type:complete len:466 (+),score=180.72 TRINITY_DN915_c0_g1_i4:12-1409(+)
MLYISKMVPTPDKSRFYAFGRVFSGTVSTGQKVRILGPNYVHGKKEDLYEKAIQRTVIMMGKYVESVQDVPAGNTVALIGIDQYLTKTGTIATDIDACTIRNMKYSVSPVVRCAVKPKKQQDLTRLIDGLKKLAKSDPLVVVQTDETGDNIIAASGELHMEICLKDLRDDYTGGLDFIASDPVVSYRETVTEKSSEICMSKSPNKHNRLYCSAQPLDEALAVEIENSKLTPKDDPKARSARLVKDYNWDKNDTEKIWCFGPETIGPNLLVDVTKGVQYMNEIRDSCESAFQWATREGALIEEPMRAVRINMHDVTLHADAIHRGAGQLIPTARRVYYACQMTGKPKFQEPIFLVEINAPQNACGGVYQCLNKRRGIIQSDEEQSGSTSHVIKAFLPVAESFGFSAHLRGMTGGQAFPQCVFDHWDYVNSDPYELGTKANEIVKQVRERKGLKAEVPALANYLDKL